MLMIDEDIAYARQLLAMLPGIELKTATLKKTTIKDYSQKLNSLGKASGWEYEAIAATSLATTKKSTWQARRAALRYTVGCMLLVQLESYEKLSLPFNGVDAEVDVVTASSIYRVLENIKRLSGCLQSIAEAKLPIEGRDKRHTKRNDMRGLPEDWRERIINRMRKHAVPALVAAVTGCRPAELVSGVALEIDGDGMLTAKIEGAKITDKSGQPWRILSWNADNTSALVRRLYNYVCDQQSELPIRVSVKDAKAFSGAMRAAGEREWPSRKSAITAYCMRHQAAADMKASGSMSSGEISAALGHISDVTKTTYGHSNMGKSAGGVAPDRVLAARPVLSKTQTKAALDFKNEKFGDGEKPSGQRSKKRVTP